MGNQVSVVAEKNSYIDFSAQTGLNKDFADSVL